MTSLRARTHLVDSNGNSKPAPGQTDSALPAPPAGKSGTREENKKQLISSASDKTVRVVFFGLVLDLLGEYLPHFKLSFSVFIKQKMIRPSKQIKFYYRSGTGTFSSLSVICRAERATNYCRVLSPTRLKINCQTLTHQY